ncbi:redox-regulated ATPase YchF [Chloroflexota bacterium]
MEIGIIGLPKSGKTTVFNGLTGGKAETDAYTPTVFEPNLGVAKVPDYRLLRLEAIFKPKRTVPVEVKYIDIAIPKGKGLSGELLAYLSKADALIHVVRVFFDESVPHIEGSIDPGRDIATINLELVLSDLAIMERRLKRIEDSLKGAKPQEREKLLVEQNLMARIRSALEEEVPLQDQKLTDHESKMIENYQFLSAKPLLVLLNIGEEQLSQACSVEADLHSRYPQLQFAIVCGKLEMELGQLGEVEASEFRAAMGVEGTMTSRVIELSYDLLEMISFFTVASNEVRSWTVSRNTPAPRAAGKIHSDMERGFIRAEVISYNDIDKCGSLAEARKQGLLRLEGKNYIVRDGDVITFLFNV